MHHAYVGSGSWSETITQSGDGFSSTETTAEEWDEDGSTDLTYDFTTESVYTPADDGWATKGVATTVGTGDGSWVYAGKYTYDDSSSSSYSYSDEWGYSKGSSSSENHVSDIVDESAEWEYEFTTVSTVSPDGSVVTVTDASASGNSSSARVFTANGKSDSYADAGGKGMVIDHAGDGGGMSPPDGGGDGPGPGGTDVLDPIPGGGSWTSHSESHSNYDFTLTENADSEWEEAYTITTDDTGTTIEGSGSGTTDATGHAAYNHHSDGYSESSSSGDGYSSYSYSSYYSNVNTEDDFDYHGGWDLVASSSGITYTTYG
jgi:hypothetical protein